MAMMEKKGFATHVRMFSLRAYEKYFSRFNSNIQHNQLQHKHRQQQQQQQTSYQVKTGGVCLDLRVWVNSMNIK